MNWYKTFFGINEVTLIRYVLSIVASLCFISGTFFAPVFGNNTVVLVQAAVAFLALIASFFFKDTKKLRRLVNWLIYFINFSNLYIAIYSKFEDRIAYQYILIFVISSLFFNSRYSFFISALINSVLLLLTIIIFPMSNCSSVPDFIFSFLMVIFPLILIKLNNFNVEDQLIRSENKYRLLAENSVDIICLHNKDGNFTFVSSSFYNQTGYKAGDSVLSDIRNYIHPQDLVALSEAFYKCSLENVNTSVQYRILKKSGEYSWFETYYKTINYNSLDRILSQTRNIQHLKETMQLMESQNIALEESQKNMETFTYISSHDLMEPLRMIASYLQLFSNKYGHNLPETAKEYIDYAQKGTKILQLLIRDLLVYTTLNNRELIKNNVKLSDLINDVLHQLKLMIEEKNVEISTIHNNINLYVDNVLFAQVLQNLIQNAIKYNEKEYPRIEVYAEITNNEIRIKITDNGPGIKKEYQEYVFEPFKRLTNKFEQSGGTGLGLSICKKIVEKHHGEIKLISDGANGSTFIIVLPSEVINTPSV